MVSEDKDTANFDVASGAHAMMQVSSGGSSAHESRQSTESRHSTDSRHSIEGGRRFSALAHEGGRRGSALDVERGNQSILVEAVSAAQADRDHARVRI